MISGFRLLKAKGENEERERRINPAEPSTI
jgi:hypothetical protein